VPPRDRRIADKVIRYLATNGPTYPSELASILKTDRSSVYRRLRALEKGKFISRPPKKGLLEVFGARRRALPVGRLGSRRNLKYFWLAERGLVRALLLGAEMKRLKKYCGTRGTDGTVADFLDFLDEQMRKLGISERPKSSSIDEHLLWCCYVVWKSRSD